MRIVSWNCCGKFREKYKYLQKVDADVYVIQECENPEVYSQTEYGQFARNFVWIGQNKSKGLGIFAKREILLEKQNWNSYCLKYFLPVEINKSFTILGVWTKRPYIEEYYVYHCINKHYYNDKTVIIGDFNSSSAWDHQHYDRNHTAVVKDLESMNLISAYHYITGEEQGKETIPTFYLYRHADKTYHLDYCFLNKDKIISFEILGNEWLKHSDHVPILLKLNMEL